MISLMLIRLVSLIVAVPALAGPVPDFVEGTFAFRGDYVIDSHVHHEIVVTLNSAERDRLVRLQREGYSCVAKPAQHQLCSKAMPVDPANGAVARRVREKFRDHSVEFKEAFSPQLLVESDFYRLWRADQKVILNFPGRPADAVRVYEIVDYAWVQGVEKISPGGQQNPERDVYLPTPDGLEAVFPIQTQPSRFQMDSYLVRVKMPRIHAE